LYGVFEFETTASKTTQFQRIHPRSKTEGTLQKKGELLKITNRGKSKTEGT